MLDKNIHDVDTYKKGYIDFCRQESPALQKSHALPQMGLSQFSPNILLFSKNLL